MDGYLLPRDSSSYRPSASASAAFSPYAPYPSSSSYLYQPSFPPPRDRWSLPSGADLQSYSSYPRPPLDRHSLASSRSFQPETFPSRGFSRRAPEFRPRPRGGDAGRPKKKPTAAQNLGPTKKISKQKQAAKPVQKSVQQGKKEGGQKEVGKKEGAKKEVGKKALKVEPEAEKPKSTKNLAMETKELHDLWRSGKKRKAEEDVKEEEPPKKQEEKPMEQEPKKKAKGKKNKKWGKKNKKWGKKARTDGKAEGAENEKVGNLGMTDEEKQAILDLQKSVCKTVSEFLGFPAVDESAKEAVPTSEADGELKEDTQVTLEVKASDKEVLPEAEGDAVQKPETLSPEELERLEGEAMTFFSKLFEENQELRKLYVDKCNNGMFDCLVCASIDGKVSKKFRNLVSLVMHAGNVSRTKKLPEHRAYGRAVCSVLEWDPLRLPKVPRGRGIGPKGSTSIQGDAADGAAKQENDAAEAKSSVDVKDGKAENGDDTQMVDEVVEEAAEAKDEQVEKPVDGST